MLLQPIVENSIRHAISKKAEGGSIMIVGRKERGRVIISVSDDGSPTNDNCKRGWGIGISNTRARLQQLFESDFAFEVRPTERGTVVRIEVPFRLHAAVEAQEASA
jgi:LytS/YehU family sensor histidine kinase